MGVEIKNVRKSHTAMIALVFALFIVGFGTFSNQAILHRGNASFTDVNGISVSSDEATIKITAVTMGATDETRGVKRVSVAIDIQNTSSEQLVISPGFQMFLFDKEQRGYPITARYMNQNDTIGGPIEVGKSTSMVLDYDIAKGATPAQFTFQLNASTQKLVAEL